MLSSEELWYHGTYCRVHYKLLDTKYTVVKKGTFETLSTTEAKQIKILYHISVGHT